jgi:hypothetical protein
MNYTLIIPGAIIALLLFIAVNRRFKLVKIPQIKFKKPKIDVDKFDSFIRNLCFICFFCMIFVGIYMIYKPTAFIICGIAGLWFCFPRGKGK